MTIHNPHQLETAHVILTIQTLERRSQKLLKLSKAANAAWGTLPPNFEKEYPDVSEILRALIKS